MDNKAKKEKGLSKHNYGSMKGHSTEAAILDKRLIFDYAKEIEEVNVCAISDLESCCDR